MKRASVPSILVAVVLLAVAVIAEAQQQTKVTKIGWLSVSGGRDDYKKALRALGYIEGKNIAFEYRSAEGEPGRFPALADELVRLKVDLIVANATTAALAAKNATRTIPIVFTSGGDPVAVGLIDSLARPGGNLTGFSNISSELAGKRLEFLKETVPKLSRIAVMWDPQNPGSAQQWKESQLPARELALQLHSIEVSRADKFEAAFKEAVNVRTAALAVMASPFFYSNQKQLTDLAIKNRLPVTYPREEFVTGGGLMSYGSDRSESFRRAALMVDKILKGAKPADLPVEQPTKFELVINLKTANQIGLPIPPSVLARADRVIK